MESLWRHLCKRDVKMLWRRKTAKFTSCCWLHDIIMFFWRHNDATITWNFPVFVFVIESRLYSPCLNPYGSSETSPAIPTSQTPVLRHCAYLLFLWRVPWMVTSLMQLVMNSPSKRDFPSDSVWLMAYAYNSTASWKFSAYPFTCRWRHRAKCYECSTERTKVISWRNLSLV